ncbi:sigma-70 family RNA polymerase sigma factor [Paenibacillus planticolens]|uniref:Sigma-70 family RNA polymerase sigma factor n=1 Tax=Paenibacillus planticolens TaxID=2654976 RepID=A0ABX1ZSH5_9BACL|nr:sigma-70 family RNA polymerase sigma factor [Paenibacillus planticolens]NOV01789.1 sigma-70 family RNA polymerase sigma factor [Paenibacillus planticolens]
MNVNASSSKPLYDMYVKMKIYKETGCEETATALLLHYEPIVRMAVGKMSRSRPDLYEDLFQVGQMSLLRLFTQYDSTLDTPFEAYAMKSLIGHLKNYLRDKSWYIQVPRRIKEKGALVQRALDELTVKLERSPNMDEMAAYLELSTEETIEILAGRDYYHYTSLDTPLSNEGDSATLGDMIAGSTDDYHSLERRMDLEEAMTCLKEEERKVIHLIYQEGQSQRHIADQLGISQMSVSRIQKRAIVKLKTVLTPST